jgi:hypothetical protein
LLLWLRRLECVRWRVGRLGDFIAAPNTVRPLVRWRQLRDYTSPRRVHWISRRAKALPPFGRRKFGEGAKLLGTSRRWFAFSPFKWFCDLNLAAMLHTDILM